MFFARDIRFQLLITSVLAVLTAADALAATAVSFPSEYTSRAERARMESRLERYDISPPEDTASSVKLGFAEFSADSGGQRAAGALASQLFRGMPSDMPYRQLPEREIRAVQQQLLEDAYQRQIGETDKLYTKIDELLFSAASPSQRRDQRAELQQQLDDQRERLQIQRDIPLAAVTVPETKTVEISSPSNRDIYPVHSAGEEMPSALDVLVGGTVTELGEYLQVEVRLYSSYSSEKGELLYRNVLREEDVTAELDAIRYQVLQAVVARELVVVTLRVPGHEDAAIYYGSDRNTAPQDQPLYLEPGEYTFTVVTDHGNVHRTTRDVRLAGDGDADGSSDGLELVLDLPEFEPRVVDFAVFPYGVEVYRGARFAGFTPMELDAYSGAEILRLRREGYRERLIPLQDGSVGDASSLVAAELQRNTFPLDTEVAAARGEFYDALGLFALSVPLWVLSGAVIDQLLPLDPDQLLVAAKTDYRNIGSAGYYAQQAFRGISLVLGVHTAVRLARYIRFAQAEHTGEY